MREQDEEVAQKARGGFLLLTTRHTRTGHARLNGDQGTKSEKIVKVLMQDVALTLCARKTAQAAHFYVRNCQPCSIALP